MLLLRDLMKLISKPGKNRNQNQQNLVIREEGREGRGGVIGAFEVLVPYLS